MSKQLPARLSLTWLAGIALAAAPLFTHAALATGNGQDVNRAIHWPVAAITGRPLNTGTSRSSCSGQSS